MEDNKNEQNIEEENPETFFKLKKVLDDSQIEYKLIEVGDHKLISNFQHAPAKTSEESAKIRNTTIESGAKALILKADKSFVLLVLSAVLKFNSKLTKKILNTKSLRFAELNEVKSLTVH
jgi:prolyl-tRNA editing enzyme YbaK/EbsC (Cys-tRNA(Pro) deacylase)